MKIIRKFVACLIAAVVSVGVMSAVSSASITDTAVAIESGHKISGTLKENANQSYFEYDYKITPNKSGLLKLSFSVSMNSITFTLYDSYGNNVLVDDLKITTGSSYETYDGGIGQSFVEINRNDKVDKAKGTVSYKVGKGTYYLRVGLTRYTSTSWFSDEIISATGTGKYSIKVTYPSKQTAKISYLSFTVKKGDKINFSPVMNVDNVAVKWKSSKSSVATVSENGVVTAKKRGSAIISATAGKSTKKFKIIVK